MSKRGAGAETEGLAIQGEGEDIAINLSNVAEGTFEVLPKATYACFVAGVEFGYSQNNNPMWTWTLEVEEGDFAGRKLFFHTTFNEKALPMAKRAIARVAPELLEGAFNPRQVADEDLLVGKRCRVKVGIRKYEGEDRNNVRDLLAPTEGSGAGFLD